MILGRQLLVGICIIFAVILFDLQTLSALSTKVFLKQKLTSHAQDNANNQSKPIENTLSNQELVFTKNKESWDKPVTYHGTHLDISIRIAKYLEVPVVLQNIESQYLKTQLSNDNARNHQVYVLGNLKKA